MSKINDNKDSFDSQKNNIDKSCNQNKISESSDTFKEIKNNFKDEKIENKKVHPLNFYALGEVHSPSKFITTFAPSKGFRSSSNDLIRRNIFSINTRYYDELKKIKQYSSINQQKISENDYMHPLKVYNSFHKYNMPSNSVNTETYNLTKEKLFASDHYSTIKAGRNITREEFYDQKGMLLSKTGMDLSSNNKNHLSIDSVEKKDIKKKYENIKTEGNDKVSKSLCSTSFVFKDPNDYKKEKLLYNDYHFDRNNKQFLKIKNWWKKDE